MHAPFASLQLPHAFPSPEDSAAVPIAELVEAFLRTKTSWETQRAYRREVTGFFHCQNLDPKRRHFADLLALGLAELYNGIYLYLRACLRIDQHTQRILNPRTYNRRRHALSSFFGFLVKFFGFRLNPMVYINALDAPTRSNTPDLTEDEVLAILHYLKKRAPESETRARDFLLVLGLVLAALRRREIAELRWDQIDFATQSACLFQKGNKEKLIPIPAGYLALLTEFREKYGQPCVYVFHPVQNHRLGELAKPISVSYIYQFVKRTAAVFVPGKNISPHSFRTTFVTLGLRWEADINAIKNGTAHLSTAMVLYYDRRNPLENNFIHLLGEFMQRQNVF